MHEELTIRKESINELTTVYKLWINYIIVGK